MKLFLAGVGLGLAVGWLATARADDVADAAEQAGVPEILLRGALASQPGVELRQYLQFDGLEQPSAPPFNPRVECIIARESGGLDVPNRQGSGATGPGQYMPGTWRAHTLEMGMPWLNIHSLADVRRVAAHDLALGRRGQWTVSGC